MQAIFTGIATALVTPFTRQHKIDFKALGNLIERQIKMKVDALLILGTTGEISTLTHNERLSIIDFALKIVNGRKPFIFGIGGNDPKSIIELGQYVAARCSQYPKIGIMVTAPYYNKGTQEGIFHYFQAITNAVKLPTIIYNIPGRTGVNITPETMARLSRLHYVAGIKEASGNMAQITKVVQLCPNLAVYCGDDTLALPLYAIGCQGIISVASNVNVMSVKRIYNAYQQGKVQLALKLFQRELPFYHSLFKVVNPIPIKYELAQLGLIQNALRLPLEQIK